MKEEYTLQRLPSFERKRNSLNSRNMRYFLDDKYGFHMFARQYNLKVPNLIGVLHNGQYKDCILNI